MRGEREPGQVNAREFWAYGIPFGRIIFSASQLSPDQQTRSGIVQAREVLQNEGLVILDFHGTLVDIVITSAQATKHLPIQEFMGPVGASYVQKRILGHLINKMNEVRGVQAIPVIRKEDGEEESVKNLTRDQIGIHNEEYLRMVKEHVGYPHHAAMIAPFGSRTRDPNSVIKWGVAEVLQTGHPAICTYTATRKGRRYRILFSDRLLRYGHDSRREDMTKEISQEFETLRQRAA